MTRRTIIPFSSGLDSTYTVFKTLRDTTDDVTLVMGTNDHLPNTVNFRAGQASRNGQMGKRGDAIVAWFNRNMRPVSIEFMPVDPSLDTGFEVPSVGNLVVVAATQAINADRYDCLRVTYEPDNCAATRPAATRDFRKPSSTEHCLWLFQKYATRGRIEFPLLNCKYTQARAMIDMPNDLKALTGSCAFPRADGTPCEVCYKCAKRKFFNRLLASGATPEEVYDSWEQKCLQPNGKWRSLKLWIIDFVPEFKPLWEPDIRPLPRPVFPDDWEVSPPGEGQ